MSAEFGPRELEGALELLRLALAEDGVHHDRTTAIAVPTEREAACVVRARESGVISGLPLIELTYDALEAEVDVRLEKDDGDAVEAGADLARLTGPLGSILTGERTFLNFLGPLSGTATLTRRFVDAVGPGCQVLDTRKTWPGARVLQKYAVRCGGGVNHRFGLDDAILLKDNHLGGDPDWAALVQTARSDHPGIFVEIEVDTFEQLDAVLGLEVDRIMLDNFDPDAVRRAVSMRSERKVEVPFEVSGGVTLETAPRLAEAGADCVSVGALTHSAPNLDVGLDLEP